MCSRSQTLKHLNLDFFPKNIFQQNVVPNFCFFLKYRFFITLISTINPTLPNGFWLSNFVLIMKVNYGISTKLKKVNDKNVSHFILKISLLTLIGREGVESAQTFFKRPLEVQNFLAFHSVLGDLDGAGWYSPPHPQATSPTLLGLTLFGCAVKITLDIIPNILLDV